MTFVEHYPHPYHPVMDNEVQTDITVEVFQLRPTDQGRLLAWAGGGILLADGGVILTGGGTTITARLALGDYAVRGGQDPVFAVPAEQLFARYRPAASAAEVVAQSTPSPGQAPQVTT